jgi:hypothetical protein
VKPEWPERQIWQNPLMKTIAQKLLFANDDDDDDD